MSDTEPPASLEAAPAPVAVERQETCSLATVRRVAAMLDLDPDACTAAGTLPRGWQFTLMGADTPRSSLRDDGFPGLGVSVPDLGLPRLMLGGRSVDYLQDIPLGARLQRRSQVLEMRHKSTEQGPMAVLTIAHTLSLPAHAGTALVETQTYLLMPARRPSSPPTRATPTKAAAPQPRALHRREVHADATMLFQYSALGFNSHKIHLDRRHAQEVEGFEDLVVNGGLTTLLMTEFLRQELGVQPKSLKARHLAPLYCDRRITLTAEDEGTRWHLCAYDDRHTLALDMEVVAQ